MSELKAFKVFREIENDDGESELYSINVARKYKMLYQPGEKTRALKGTELFVFVDIGDAFEFLSFNRTLLTHLKGVAVLWNVKCGDEVRECLHVSTMLGHRFQDERSFNMFWNWRRDMGRNKYYHANPAPAGTYTCDWVIPTKKIV